MRKQQQHNKRPQQHRPMQDVSIASLLGEDIDFRLTRCVLEIRFPIPLYVLIEGQDRYRLIGHPGLPGHFQVGKLNRKEWTPAIRQEGLLWESKQERDCTLHRLHRRQGMAADLETVLVQHSPTYTSLDRRPILESIDLVKITPLWDTKQAYSTFTCSQMLQCGCPVYQSLLETYRYHWQ